MYHDEPNIKISEWADAVFLSERRAAEEMKLIAAWSHEKIWKQPTFWKSTCLALRTGVKFCVGPGQGRGELFDVLGHSDVPASMRTSYQHWCLFLDPWETWQPAENRGLWWCGRWREAAIHEREIDGSRTILRKNSGLSRVKSRWPVSPNLSTVSNSTIWSSCRVHFDT